MGTVVLCHKWLRKQGKPDVQINVSWLKGKKTIIKIQELTLYQSPTCHTTNTERPNKSAGTAGRSRAGAASSLCCLELWAFRPCHFLSSVHRLGQCTLSLGLPNSLCWAEQAPCSHTNSAGRNSKSDWEPNLIWKTVVFFSFWKQWLVLILGKWKKKSNLVYETVGDIMPRDIGFNQGLTW